MAHGSLPEGMGSSPFPGRLCQTQQISPPQISSVLYSLCETAKAVFIYSARPRCSDTTALLRNHFANNLLLYRSIQDEKEGSQRKAVVANGFS